MKPVDSKTVAEINARVDSWESSWFSSDSKPAIREFLANEKGMSFFRTLATFGSKK